MLSKFLNAAGHYVIGLATIGACAGLMASGHMDETAGTTIISGLGIGLAGIGAVTKTAGSTTTSPGG